MKFHTIKELVELTELSEWQLRREIRAGRLRAVVGRGMERGYRVSDAELERWWAEEWVPPEWASPTRSPSSR